MLQKLQTVSPKILYVLLAIAIAVPMLNPIRLPLRISQSAQKVYETVESLPPNSYVLISVDYSAGGAPELHPQLEAFVRHLAKKQLKVVAVSFNPDGPLFADQAFKALEAAGKVYGKDFINLGYRSGGEGAVAMMAQDIKAAFPTDFKGRNTAEYPIMEGLSSAKSFALIYQINNGFGTAEFVRQVQAQYGVKLACGMSQSLAPANLPYLQSGQLFAILGGLRGAAEYEILTGQLAKGSSAMGSQTLGHLLVILFLCVGNVCYFLAKKATAKSK